MERKNSTMTSVTCCRMCVCCIRFCEFVFQLFPPAHENPADPRFCQNSDLTTLILLLFITRQAENSMRAH